MALVSILIIYETSCEMYIIINENKHIMAIYKKTKESITNQLILIL